MDPSESIRSEDIPSIFARQFQITDQREYGGTLLALVLNNIVGNFRDCLTDIAILERLADDEDRWISEGRLSSDYILLIGKSK